MIRNLNVINSLFINYNLKLFALYERECNWAIHSWATHRQLIFVRFGGMENLELAWLGG